MVFGQGNMEMVIQSMGMKYSHSNETKESKLICVVFYGPNVPFINAKTLASELLTEFHRKYNKQVSRLISKYEMNNLIANGETNHPVFDHMTSSDGAYNDNGTARSHEEPHLGLDARYGASSASQSKGSNKKNSKNTSSGNKNSKNVDTTELDQESIMSQFKKTFDVTAMRLIQKHIDTRELRRKDRENEHANDGEQSIDGSENDNVETHGTRRNSKRRSGNNANVNINNNNGRTGYLDSGQDSGMESPYGNEDSKSQSDSQSRSNPTDGSNIYDKNTFSETEEKQQDMYRATSPYSPYGQYGSHRKHSKYAGSRYDF